MCLFYNLISDDAGKKLKEERKSWGMSRKKLASLTNIEPEVIEDIERGYVCMMNYDMLSRMCKSFFFFYKKINKWRNNRNNKVGGNMKLINYTNFLAIQKLEGGTYNIDSIWKAIKTLTNWALSVGIAAAGMSLVIGFILYAVADVDKKAHVKQRIIQTLLGITGIILAISLVNLIIDLF